MNSVFKRLYNLLFEDKYDAFFKEQNRLKNDFDKGYDDYLAFAGEKDLTPYEEGVISAISEVHQIRKRRAVLEEEAGYEFEEFVKRKEQ